MKTLEVYFDTSSPWTYLALTMVGDVARRTGAEIEWKPILVGGIFNQVNKQVYETRAEQGPKFKYMLKDLQDWSRRRGVPIGWPSVFPVNAVKAQRACCAALDQGPDLERFSLALCKAYWEDDRDISQDEVIADCCETVGLDASAILAATQDQAVKDRLRDFTQEVVDRGGFGSPTMFVNRSDMYFGQDRMALIEEALA